jgi:hypothetical protein
LRWRDQTTGKVVAGGLLSGQVVAKPRFDFETNTLRFSLCPTSRRWAGGLRNIDPRDG